MSYPIQKNPNLITRFIDGEAVIMLPEVGKVLALNEVGSYIWQLIDGEHSRADLLEALCHEFEVPKEEAAQDLNEFLTLLQSKNLLNMPEYN